ncbi:hypothetical protein ACGFYU_29055 [Streptomyces sp. NPDC048337]|uniref:hypothetical protein n=1 Tax=Streptomyces sp. NPDC048337 TaxID=3365535 RepID=UPI003711BF50
MNFTPWSAIQPMVFWMAQSVCLGWSSVTISRMLGRVAAAAAVPGVDAWARDGVAAAAATAAAPARKRRLPTEPVRGVLMCSLTRVSCTCGGV